jgi:Ca2+-transporting ATPase
VANRALPGPDVSDDMRGLSTQDAQVRLLSDGFNELPSSARRTPLLIITEVMREPMLALLLGGGLIYLILGDLGEALVLLLFATVSVAITVIQESRTERVLEALRDLTSPRALVIRDGARVRIPGRDVVRGDTIILAEGDRVAADVLIRQGADLQADESLLTGESVPVRKIAALPAARAIEPKPGGDDLPFAFSGTLIVRGSGIAEVIATGPRTELGKIGQSLQTLETDTPRLTIQLRRIVRIFATVGGAVSGLVVLLYGFLRGDWLDALLAGIAVGMSMLPEEFPVVLTVFLAMGAWRISRARVLTRRASAIETLGAATVLCTDKTGTLTQNRMTITELRLKNGDAHRPTENPATAMPETFVSMLSLGVLACAPDPHDPMEKAFHALDSGQRKNPGPAPRQGELVRAYGLRPDLLAMSNAWSMDDEKSGLLIATKGAPEAIADLCRLNAEDRRALMISVEDMAARGMRVLGVARATHQSATLPDSQREFAFEFIGLVGLADPLRPSVPEAVRQCRSAGIKVIMITGDYPATARAIAREAGIDADMVIAGDELNTLSDPDLAARLRSGTIFARIMPEQKLRIVEALKANGEVVAMTGDGVNDAPSLKAAHIGIAMGGRGTDVAREASSIVLLDDDFGSVVKAIMLGRRIYDNLRKAVGFIIAVHVPIAGLALMPLLLGFPLLLEPIHIAFLEMVIDPVCTLVFEAESEEDDIIRRPPRNPAEPLFSNTMIGWGVFQGAIAMAMVGAIFFLATQRGMPEVEVRALTFFALFFSIIGLVFVNRSYSTSVIRAFTRPNATLVIVLAIVTSVLGLTTLWPAVRDLFNFGPLYIGDILLTLAAGVSVLVLLDLAKIPLLRRATRQRP